MHAGGLMSALATCEKRGGTRKRGGGEALREAAAVNGGGDGCCGTTMLPNLIPTHLWCLCHLLEKVLGVQQAGVHLGRCLVAEAHHKYLSRRVT